MAWQVVVTAVLLVGSNPFGLFLSSSSKFMAHGWTIGVLGGTGKIGTAVATHLLYRQPETELVLVGRRSKNDPSTVEAIDTIVQTATSMSGVETNSNNNNNPVQTTIRYVQVKDTWDSTQQQLQDSLRECDCIIHTAGPYLDQTPTPLQVAIESSRCKAYVDVSDPLDFLDLSLEACCFPSPC